MPGERVEEGKSEKLNQALQCYRGREGPGGATGAYSPLLQQELYLQLLHALQWEEGGQP